ncbi:MAG: hypothetical protein ACHWZW_13625 [Spirulina sp.]
MDIQTLIYGALIACGAAYLVLNRKPEVTHQEVPIPIPVDNRRP